MTKLGVYVLCLSVIESVIPKSKKTTLAANFPPSISLGILPNAVFPDLVVQLYLNGSSDLLIIEVLGIFACNEILLFDKLHVPLSPFENDNVTGTFASLTMVEHEVKKTRLIAKTIFLIVN